MTENDNKTDDPFAVPHRPERQRVRKTETIIENETQLESFIVAYDSTHKITAEIWFEDETLFAEMSWGKLHIGDDAKEILKEVVSSESINIRTVNQSSHTKKNE